ncbi:MAG: septal ring lytic transglycosylase RlpA family protein [Pseudomonadota bacterium]
MTPWPARPNRGPDRRHIRAPLARGALALAAVLLPSGSAFAAGDSAADGAGESAGDGDRKGVDDKANAASLAPGATAQEHQDPPPGPTFAVAFDPLGAPSPITLVDPGAVDLSAFEPPRGPRVLRSLGTKVASYYGKRFHGRLTANGERFDMNAMTAAHKTLPFGTRVRVTNPANGRAVTVRINDRGPFIAGRAIDLSRAAAQRIGLIQRGHARVQLDIVAP